MDMVLARQVSSVSAGLSPWAYLPIEMSSFVDTAFKDIREPDYVIGYLTMHEIETKETDEKRSHQITIVSKNTYRPR